MFVHREEYFLSGEERSKLTDEERQAYEGQAKLLLRKQRNGPIGDVLLTWRKEFTRFERRDKYHDGSEMEFSRQSDDFFVE